MKKILCSGLLVLSLIWDWTFAILMRKSGYTMKIVMRAVSMLGCFWVIAGAINRTTW